MKSLQLFLVVLCLSIFSINELQAQEKKQVYKTTTSDTPAKVKETLKKYANYDISKEITYTKEEKSTIYRVLVKKGSWEQYLHIDDSGKIVGIESAEE